MRVKNTFLAPLLLCTIAILLLVTQNMNPELIGYSDNLYLSVTILQILVLILPSMFYVRLKGTGYALKLNLRFFGMRAAFFLVCAFIALLAGSASLQMIMYHFGGYSYSFTLFDSFIPTAVAYEDPMFAYLLVAFAAIPAVAEEFLFRAVLLSEYTRSSGEKCAFFAVTAAYAMLMPSFVAQPNRIFIGAVFTAVAIITRSALAPMLIHFGYNIVGLIFEPIFRNMLKQSGTPVYMLFAAVTIFLVFLVLSLNEAERLYFYYGANGIDEPEIERSAPKTFFKRATEAFLSPPYLAYIVIFIISAVVRYIRK